MADKNCNQCERDASRKIEVEGTRKEREQKWNGWGFKDSYFYFDDDAHFWFAGKGRYDISGHILPRLRDFAAELGIDVNFKTPSQDRKRIESTITDPILNETFIKFLDHNGISYSVDKALRLNRAHGHGLPEMYALRHGKFARVPDIIVWPKDHNDVVKIVSAANTHNVVVIPHGGGTNVTLGLRCPEHETRMIVTLDLVHMNRLIWINDDNMTACAEAGCVGVDLEEELNKRGYTMGHEPDSIEISTLGGWICTRASGMKRMKYGNIEDIVIGVTMVTSRGVVERSSQAPRSSSGPDIIHFILGSEGTLGVVTKAIFRIWKNPECKRYGSVVFPSFECGVKCMRDATLQKCAPASMRLVDNKQFAISQAFKKGPLTIWKRLTEQIQHLYITSWKGFDPNEVCAMTLTFEGSHEEVKTQERLIYRTAAHYGGFSGGAASGRYGYMLTFSVAYLRDIGMEHGVIGDSMETSVPWDKVLEMCKKVKTTIQQECLKIGAHNIVTLRVTQAYNSGACIYIYCGMNYRNIDNPMDTYARIEDVVREVILSHGGTISHHHGVGKLRRKWLPAVVGDVGVTIIRATKESLDPKNVFACGNLLDSNSKL